MEDLFNKSEPYEKYRYILEYPLKADLNSKTVKDKSLHGQKLYEITSKGIRQCNRKVILIDSITNLFFVYTDFGSGMFDENYWFFIAEYTKDDKTVYIGYESECCGTGFGFCETSKVYLAETKELLYEYGLTYKQRYLIMKNIETRFKCDSVDLLAPDINYILETN
jgi:hypothetical protein